MAAGTPQLRVVEGASKEVPLFERMAIGQLGMVVLFVSLSAGFLASIAGYIVVRVNNQGWTRADMPELPAGLFASTIVLLFVSYFFHKSVAAGQNDEQEKLKTYLSLGTLCVVGFVGAQTWNWVYMATSGLPPDAKSLYAFTFWMLTVLHALHVVGGLIPSVLVLRKGIQGRYGPLNFRGLSYHAQYWHFLDIVWVIMLITMFALT